MIKLKPYDLYTNIRPLMSFISVKTTNRHSIILTFVNESTFAEFRRFCRQHSIAVRKIVNAKNVVGVRKSDTSPYALRVSVSQANLTKLLGLTDYADWVSYDSHPTKRTLEQAINLLYLVAITKEAYPLFFVQNFNISSQALFVYGHNGKTYGYLQRSLDDEFASLISLDINSQGCELNQSNYQSQLTIRLHVAVPYKTLATHADGIQASYRNLSKKFERLDYNKPMLSNE